MQARNDGRAVWLATARGEKGVVKLRWRWLEGEQDVPWMSGELPLRVDVFPRRSYGFRASIDPPQEAGTFRLEVGLVSEHVASFSDLGIPPLRLTVKVEPFPAPPEWERLRVEEAPRLSLFTDRRGYRIGDVLRLSVAVSAGSRPWVIDAYLVLRRPDGALWLHIGQQLVERGRGPLTPLKRGIELRKGFKRSGLLLNLRLAGMATGSYTWHLLLTEAGSFQIIAEAGTTVEVIP